MDMLCPCNKADVAPASVFEMVTAGKKFFNADMKCEFAGNAIVEKVESGEITQNVAINECMEFANRIKGKKDSHMLSWMCMHLALGLCHKFGIKDKSFVQNIMKQILPLSRGVDGGIFFRDILSLGEEGQFLSGAEKDLLEKATYYLKIATGFKVDMRDNDYARSVYGPLRTNIPDSTLYFDLPLGNPAYAMGTAPSSTSGPLLTACENLKPHAVLILLRHGATAHGDAMAYVLASLSHAKTIEEKTKRIVAESPIEMTKLILKYLLRAVNQLKLKFDDQKIGEIDHEADVYYVSKNVEQFVDANYYKCPNKLKQLVRVKIRELFLASGKLPEGLYDLPRPLITSHKRYLDLLS